MLSSTTRSTLARSRRLPSGVAAIVVLIALSTTVAEAKRTIRGRITDRAGRAVSGLRVDAYDSDTGADDFMGRAVTNYRGDYQMTFAGGHWDPFPHRITRWRPDIYVKVYVYVRNQWVFVTKSRVFGDRPHRYDTRIDFEVARNDDVTRMTAFNPAYHGFPFRNHPFTVCAAPTCRDEHWAGEYLRRVLSFKWALCGGMSLTALRRFEAGRPAEDFSPELKEELVRAQLETVSLGVWAKFIEWQAKPTLPHTLSPHTVGHSTKGEWWKFKQSIDAGRPMILGLIRIQSLNPFRASDNHQVLGIGYRFNELTREVEIYTYDPNHPDLTSVISMNIGLPNSQIQAQQYTPVDDEYEKVRGFFVIESVASRIVNRLDPRNVPFVPKKKRRVSDAEGKSVDPMAPFVRGDSNSDGNVDLGDAVFLLNYVAGGPAPACEKSCDSNDDGRLDPSDAVFLLGYLFAGGSAPPAPHAVCGPDRTEDTLSCESSPPCVRDDAE